MTPEQERHVTGAGIALREAAVWITIAVRLLREIDVHSQALPDLAGWLADLSHELDPTHTRIPEEYRHVTDPTPD